MLNRLRRIIAPTHPLRLAWHWLWGVFFAWWYDFPSRQITVIGVTGTNGKTTTANLIAAILSEAGYSTALATTINFQLGKKKWDNLTKQTTLGRGGVQQFLRRAVQAGCTHAVIEVSSHGLIQHRLWGVEFDAAVLTNVTPDHLDFHNTMAEYAAAKALLFARLKSPSAPALLPATDPSLPVFRAVAPHARLFAPRRGDWQALDLRVTRTGQSWLVQDPTPRVRPWRVQTQLLGGFNVANVLGAIGVVRALGVSIRVIQSALKKFAGVPGRQESVLAGQKFRVIVDFAHTPDALEKLLRTFRAVTSGRVWLVFGATGDRDRTKRPVMGRIAEQLADEIVLTSDDPFTEDPVRIIAEVAAGIRRRPGVGFTMEVDRGRAMELALTQARPGDTVLIAGKGCEQFQVIGQTKIPWDDRRIAEKILRRKVIARLARRSSR